MPSVHTQSTLPSTFHQGSQGSFNVCFGCSDLSITQAGRHVHRQTAHIDFDKRIRWKIGYEYWNRRFWVFRSRSVNGCSRAGWVSRSVSLSVIFITDLIHLFSVENNLVRLTWSQDYWVQTMTVAVEKPAGPSGESLLRIMVVRQWATLM